MKLRNIFIKKVLWVCLGLIFLFWAYNPALAINALISDLKVANTPEAIIISTKLQVPFEGKIDETIHSGIDTTFIFKLDLLRERTFWFDEKIASREVTHTVKYDTLSKQYALQIGNTDNIHSLGTNDFEEVKQLMTNLSGIRLVPLKKITLKDNYYVRVRAKMEAIEMPFPLGYIPFVASFREFETPWAVMPLSASQHMP
jgi:hypothetical protein